MATITIYGFGNTGGPHAREVSIADLSKQTFRTQDATTSTSVESIVLDGSTKAVSIIANAAHRVSLVDPTCATTYFDVPASTDRTYDFGVQGGQTLYYRLDA